MTSLYTQAREKAIRELQLRKNARDDLLEFTLYTKKNYYIGQHHRLLCQKLQAVETGRIKRLMVFIPPRHGKSELTSKRFPAWFMGKHPDKQVIITSYSNKLAESFGRDVRNIVISKEFENIFPNVILAEDSQAKDLWSTNHQGVFLASGVGGSITGYGGDLIIIDDPIKDRQEVESQVIREGIWDWYKSVLRTRLMSNGAIILVLTRWHVDDLAGRLIQEMHNDSGEIWDIVHLPAQAMENDILGRKVGDPLWPEFFDDYELSQIKKSVGERDWSALYQGQPMVRTGSLFQTEKIRILQTSPPASKIVRRWDFAATKAIGSYDPDWTVGVKMQQNVDGGYTILDIVRFRGRPDEVEQTVSAIASQDGRDVTIILPQDPGQAGVAQAQYYIKLLAGYKVEIVREKGSKTMRADPFASQINMGNVAFIDAAWNRTFMDELTAFPNGAHDDQVDAASGAFEYMVVKRHFPKMPSMATISRI